MTDDTQSLGFRVWRSQPTAMKQQHAHADIEVNYLQFGEMRYFLGGAWRTYRAGQVVAFWASQPHHLAECAPGTHGVWLTVPLGWFLGQSAARSLVTALLTGPLTDLRSEDAALFASWAEAWESPTPMGERIVRLEVEARLLRLAPDAPGRAAISLAALLPATLSYAGIADPVDERSDVVVAAMAAVMAEHYHEELTIDDLASGTGLHPRYAMTRFKQALGVTVWEYLLRLRVAAAQRLLLTTDDDLLAITYASGFGSPARFYATFKRITGMTPRVYRMKHGQNG